MVSFLSSAYSVLFFQRFPVCSAGEEPACSAGDTGEVGSIPGLGRPPWGVKRQTAPVSLPGASHGHGSLVDHSPEGRRVRQPERPHTGQPSVTLSLKSYCYIHICVFSTLCNLKHVRLSAVCFLFFSLLLSQLSVVQKQMTPKLSHLKQLLSLGSGGWVGLGDFLMWWRGVSPGARVTSACLGAQLGLSARIPAYGLPPGLGSSTAWRWIQAWMSPRYQTEAGWLFMPYPQKFRDRISDAQITGLYRFEERKPVSCFNKNMLKSCGHLGKYTDFLYHFMKYVLIFLGYINIPLNGSCEYFLSVLGSDLHSSFILWGINSAAVNNIIVISYVFQVFL